MRNYVSENELQKWDFKQRTGLAEFERNWPLQLASIFLVGRGMSATGWLQKSGGVLGESKERKANVER